MRAMLACVDPRNLGPVVLFAKVREWVKHVAETVG